MLVSSIQKIVAAMIETLVPEEFLSVGFDGVHWDGFVSEFANTSKIERSKFLWRMAKGVIELVVLALKSNIEFGFDSINTCCGKGLV